MTIDTEAFQRSELARFFPGSPRLVRGFEDLAVTAQGTSEVATATTVALQDATILTLSANEAFTNERLFRVDASSMSLEDDGTHVTVSAKVGNDTAFRVTLVPVADSTFFLPLSGTLVTAEGPATLSAKTLAAPKLSGIGDYADDVAAAAGGVPVGGIYRTASALKVRVA